MKFSCTQENLHQGLSVVSHIANKNVNLPILGNVLIKCDDKVLRFTTTNLEIAVSSVVRGKIESVGEFTVPSRLVADYVGLLPKERVDVTLEGNALSIACGSFNTKAHGIVASEFPLIPKVDKKHRFNVKVADLKKSVSQVLFAAATNESRPEISGVLFKFVPSENGTDLILAATDSYRLAERVLTVKSEDGQLHEPITVIVPSRTVSELIRIIGITKESLNSPETLEVALGESQIMFTYDNTELISRTIEGKYPDYRQLIPDRFETEIIVSKDELMRAVKTTSLFSRSGLNDVHFEFNDGKGVRLSATNAQTGEHSVDLDGAVKGKSNKITLNFKYLLDGVGNIESDFVAMQVNDAISPCLVRPYKQNAVTNEYLYIVMPIRQ